MNFIDKLERKFPRFGITGLMKYVICINIAGVVLGLIDASGVFDTPIYYNYLSLNFDAIFHGQVWRLVTFILYPMYDFGSRSMFVNLMWFALWAYVYYFFGTMLERLWGKFRFTLFYLSGIIFVILATLVFYLINIGMYGSDGSSLMGYIYAMGVSLEYLNETLFLAYALMFPNSEFRLYFLIPVKAKWLALVSFVLLGYHLVRFIISGAYYGVALIVGALINLGLFFLFARGKQSVKGQYEQRKRKQEFRKRSRPVEGGSGGARHRCAICGRTDQDAPMLEFRYCSKCNGNYEYCSDHLFSHEHVR